MRCARTHWICATALIASLASPVAGQPGNLGSKSSKGCSDGLWKHVYNPHLVVLDDCVTVTGTIIDATANQSTHRQDGVRHEPDGDTHGWLKPDAKFKKFLDAGDRKHEHSNLVFELVCHYPVTQSDAKPACKGFKDHAVIPAVGTHVAITGTRVHDKQHGWNEIHPVSKIEER